MLPPASRKALRHRDRWRVIDMLREQPDLTAKDAGRDMDLWRHLFAPDEIVRVGRFYRAACEAAAAEWCCGNTWAGAVIEGTVALCWPASALLRGDSDSIYRRGPKGYQRGATIMTESDAHAGERCGGWRHLLCCGYTVRGFVGYVVFKRANRKLGATDGEAAAQPSQDSKAAPRSRSI